MTIAGFTKTTLRDWEGKNACKILLSDCDLNCPYCNQRFNDIKEEITQQAILDYIDGKLDFLNGIVVSGGEPSCSPDLYMLLKDLKKRKIAIRLDTNGMHPETIDDLVGAKLVDCVCMNLMAPLKTDLYSRLAGKPIDISIIKKSISVIKDSKVDNIFRTVAIPDIINEDTIMEIAKEIRFTKRYTIVQFDPSKTSDPTMSKIKPYSQAELTLLGKSAKKFVKNVCIRDI
jgi:pyruvate formate lyase activating enzyme